MTGPMTLLRIVARAVASFLVIAAILLAIWALADRLLPVPDTGYRVARSPLDVWRYFVHRQDVWGNAVDPSTIYGALGRTLTDAGLGFAVGLLAAIVLAVSMVLSRPVEAATMPVAMVLRTVPLVALAPILSMMFGHGAVIAAVMAGIVVLFPALVNIVFGLRSVSPQMADIVHVYGGSRWDALRRVALPSAVPSVFAALRISVPGAITGALLAEALATGNGLGYDVTQDAAQGQYDAVWAIVAVTTLVSLSLYLLAQLAERLVMAEMGLTPRR